MSEIIQQAKNFLKNRLYSNSSVSSEEKDYRYYHSLRVSVIGKELAKKEGGNLLTIELACILHDVGKFESPTEVAHGRISAQVARQFLKTTDLAETQINDICYAIAVHVDGDAGYRYPKIIEADIVTDADNIDRFDVLRIVQNFNYEKLETLPPAECKEVLTNKINRFGTFLQKGNLETTEGTRLFKEKMAFQLEFYKKYLTQIEQTLSEL